MRLTKVFRFEAAHVLPKHPGKCHRLHGHSWVLSVSVEGPVNPDTGFVQDFGLIKEAVQPLIDGLDHRFLGALASKSNAPAMLEAYPTLPDYPTSIYPSSENLLKYIASYLGKRLPNWCMISLEETCTSRATLERKEWGESLREQYNKE